MCGGCICLLKEENKNQMKGVVCMETKDYFLFYFGEIPFLSVKT